MIAHGAEGIGHIADVIEQNLLPLATDPTVRGEVRVTAMLVRLAAEDYDRAVDVLARDRRDLEVLFRAALPHLDGDLARRTADRLCDRPESLRVSILQQRSDEDLRVLTAIHQVAEQNPDASEVLSRIWQFLDAFAERRRFETPV